MLPPKQASAARTTAVVLGMVLLTVLALGVVYEARRVLIWLVIAGFFAVALYPVTNWVERRAVWIKRWLSTLLVFLGVWTILGGLITLMVMPLVNQGGQVATQLPDVVHSTQDGRGPLGDLLRRTHLLGFVQSHDDQLREWVTGLNGSALHYVQSVASGVVGTITIFVLAYLMVLEGPIIIDAFLALFDDDVARRIRRVGHDCARTITGYISGNLLISLIAGILTYVVLLILHVPFAGLIALFVAITDLIPLIGAAIGAIVAILAALSHSVSAAVILLVFFVIYQLVENHLLQPLIFARTVNLNPLTVLVAILVAGELAGVLGALLAIPFAGIVQVIVRDIWDTRRGRLKPEPTTGPEEDSPLDSPVEAAQTPLPREEDRAAPAV